jgi:hypothetical protein
MSGIWTPRGQTKKNAMNRSFIFATLVGTGILAMAAAPLRADDSDQSTPVQISLPAGMESTTSSVLPGPTSKTKYVIINMLRLRNQSRVQPLNVNYKDFALRTDDGDVYYVNPKVTGALPFSMAEQPLGPGQVAVGSIAFEVPATVRRAALAYYVVQFDANYPSY